MMTHYSSFEELGRGKTLIATVTPGRSGTALLAQLLSRAGGIAAEHEPAPRLNYVMRSILAAPAAAEWWLAAEKLPFLFSHMLEKVYVESSHFFAKGFIEPLVKFDIDIKFIVLTRPALEVARSLYAINCIPARTLHGRLALLAPNDPGVLAVQDWQNLSDFQLCLWYALEIERRQTSYKDLFESVGRSYIEISMIELLDIQLFRSVVHFAQSAAVIDEDIYNNICRHNQNPYGGISSPSSLRDVPPDTDSQADYLMENISSGRLTPSLEFR